MKSKYESPKAEIIRFKLASDLLFSNENNNGNNTGEENGGDGGGWNPTRLFDGMPINGSPGFGWGE